MNLIACTRHGAIVIRWRRGIVKNNSKQGGHACARNRSEWRWEEGKGHSVGSDCLRPLNPEFSNMSVFGDLKGILDLTLVFIVCIYCLQLQTHC